MLSVFPSLLVFKVLAPTILRIVSGFIFATFGWLKLTKNKESKIIFFEKIGLKPPLVWLWMVALIELVVGTMIVVGFLTQLAAMIASFIMLISIIIKVMKPKALPNTLDFYIMFLIVFISLIFSGAGLFAFDLPL